MRVGFLVSLHNTVRYVMYTNNFLDRRHSPSLALLHVVSTTPRRSLALSQILPTAPRCTRDEEEANCHSSSDAVPKRVLRHLLFVAFVDDDIVHQQREVNDVTEDSSVRSVPRWPDHRIRVPNVVYHDRPEYPSKVCPGVKRVLVRTDAEVVNLPSSHRQGENRLKAITAVSAAQVVWVHLTEIL